MSLTRLCARVARLETQCSRADPKLELLIVPRYLGHTRDTALQAAGYTPEAVAGHRVVLLRIVYADEKESSP